MADTGATYPGTASIQAVSPEDDSDWASPNYIKADDGNFASVDLPANYYSYRLKATNFGFSIPGGSSILGIKVEIERLNSGIGYIRDYRVQLLNASGNLVGANKADTGTNWPNTFTIKEYGGATDLWNASPTPAMVNDADFGVVLSARDYTVPTGGYVDFIRMTVYYSLTVQLAGQSSGEASVSGSISVLRRLSGVSSGQASVSGAIAVLRRLAGVSSGEASVSGKLLAWVRLQGLSQGVTTVIGTLTGGFKRPKRILTAVRNLTALRNIPPER